MCLFRRNQERFSKTTSSVKAPRLRSPFVPSLADCSNPVSLDEPGSALGYWQESKRAETWVLLLLAPTSRGIQAGRGSGEGLSPRSMFVYSANILLSPIHAPETRQVAGQFPEEKQTLRSCGSRPGLSFPIRGARGLPQGQPLEAARDAGTSPGPALPASAAGLRTRATGSSRRAAGRRRRRGLRVIC